MSEAITAARGRESSECCTYFIAQRIAYKRNDAPALLVRFIIAVRYHIAEN